MRCSGRSDCWIGAIVVAATLAACGGPAPVEPPDEGKKDSGVDVIPVDAAVDQDAAAPTCETTGCPSGQRCVANVCLADCGGDVGALVALLDRGARPIANVCREAAALGFTAAGARGWAMSSATSEPVTTFSIDTWAFDPAMPNPSRRGVTSAVHDAGASGLLTFPSSYLAITASASRAAFGYTTSAPDFSGGIFLADLTSRTVVELDAPGNFDAAFWDENTLLVNGLGLGNASYGEGVYAIELAAGAALRVVHVATNMGDYSGSVGRTDAGDVFFGGFGDGGHVYRVSRASLETVLANEKTFDAGADGRSTRADEVAEVLDPSGAPLSSMFATAHDRLIALPFGEPMVAYHVDATADGVTLQDARTIADDSTQFVDVVPGPNGWFLLAHAHGLLAIELVVLD